MSEPVQSRSSATRHPLGDATYRINNNRTQPSGRSSAAGKHQDDFLDPNSPRSGNANAYVQDRDSLCLPEPEYSVPDAPRSSASSRSRKSYDSRQQQQQQPRHPRTKAVQETTSSKRASQASQASTTASSNRSSGYNYKTQVGPWQLGKTLGKGSSARVRLCKHRISGEHAAVKIIPKRTAYLIQHGSLADLHKYDDSLPERIDGEMRVPLSIEREVAILKLVDHPNVMKVYDIWENRSEIYLVLEYVDHGDLFDYINSNGRLSEECAMYYFRQIMSAMQYCHGFNICHRDLKPENILLNSNNEVKIADFGMAALHQYDSHRLETACGSPHYAAPELLKNKAYCGDRADVWSLGVILYAILAASLPFDDPDVRRLLEKTKRGQYEMPAFLSVEAKDLIRRMLQVNPEVRISLKDMWRHPLISKYDYLDKLGGKNSIKCDVRRNFHYEPMPPHQIDSHLVRQLRSLWHQYDEEQIQQKLMDSSRNDQKLFYWLLHNYRQKQLENFLPELAQSPSDYHHLHQPVWRKRVSTCEFSQPRTNGLGHSVSKFTVISHVAENDDSVKSYDPYNADRPMRANSQVSHAKIVVHRKSGHASRYSSRGDDQSSGLSRNGTRSTARHARISSQRTAGSVRLNSIISSRNSVGSFHSSRQGTSYARSVSRPKRGIDFSQVKKSSVDHSNEQVRGPRSTGPGHVVFKGENVRHSAPARRVGQPVSVDIPARMSMIDRPKPKLKIIKRPDPSTVVNEAVRHFSNSIAKDCDDAFNSLTQGSDLSQVTLNEQPETKRTSTPYSLNHDAKSNPAQPVNNSSNQRPWDTRPLPPLPTDQPESPEPMNVDEPEEFPFRDGGVDDEPSSRMSKFVGRIAKPVRQPKQDRRVVSAPPYANDSSRAHAALPSISENGRDMEGVQTDKNRVRIVSAPPKTPRSRAEAEGLDHLSRMGETIRVVNSPTATSPVPKPLNVRKKHSEEPHPDPVRMHGALEEGPAESFDAASQDVAETQPKKKKTSWFRRSSKEEVKRATSVRTGNTQWSEKTTSTRPTTVATHSTDAHATDVSSRNTSIAPSSPTRKKTTFGLLFWKNGDKKPETRMSIADGPEHEDAQPADRASSSIGRKSGRKTPQSLTESDSGVRKIDVRQNWLARLFGVKPATSHLCMTISRRVARQEIAILLREWRRYGIRDIQVDKERNIVFARVGANNYLDIKEVSFAVEIMTVIEHGKRGALSIARFTQERGAASSFHQVVDTLRTVLSTRNLLVTDQCKEKMMIKTLNS